MINAPESDVMPLKLKGKLECLQPLLGKKKNRLRRRPGLDTDLFLPAAQRLGLTEVWVLLLLLQKTFAF